MARVRISTTVDEVTLAAARQLGLGNDAVLIDAALAALVAAHRSAAIDTSYQSYDLVPSSTPDEWGDLESFREAVRRHARVAVDDADSR
jgi:hypothetical protein